MTLYFWIVLVVTFVFKASNQCDLGEVRLVGGSGPHEGRVEICDNSQWGRVCSTKWDDNDATVVCRQLGYSPHGATTSTGMEFGQGDGLRWYDYVECNPTINMELLDCPKAGVHLDSCHLHDAGVKCRDELRVKSVAAHIVSTPNTSTFYTVSVTWEQNLTVEEPTSFKVECHNEQMLHSVIITVGNKKSRTQLGGLLSSSYNCCVSAVYPLYEAKEVCTGIVNTSSTSNIIMCNTRLSEATIVGGVLGIIIVILLILLPLSVVCLVRQHRRKGVISERISMKQNVSYSSIAVRRSQPTISGTPIQVTRCITEDKSTNNHTII